MGGPKVTVIMSAINFARADQACYRGRCPAVTDQDAFIMARPTRRVNGRPVRLPRSAGRRKSVRNGAAQGDLAGG